MNMSMFLIWADANGDAWNCFSQIVLTIAFFYGFFGKMWKEES